MTGTGADVLRSGDAGVGLAADDPDPAPVLPSAPTTLRDVTEVPMNELSHRPDRTGRVLDRILPLAGVCFAVLEAAGDLTIGEFPDGNTSASELTTYYSAHHGAVSLGGTLMALGGLFLALFGVSVWARLRETRASAIVGGIVLVG